MHSLTCDKNKTRTPVCTVPHVACYAEHTARNEPASSGQKTSCYHYTNGALNNYFCPMWLGCGFALFSFNRSGKSVCVYVLGGGGRGQNYNLPTDFHLTESKIAWKSKGWLIFYISLQICFIRIFPHSSELMSNLTVVLVLQCYFVEFHSHDISSWQQSLCISQSISKIVFLGNKWIKLIA